MLLRGLFVVLATLTLTGCGSLSYRIDASSDKSDPIIVTPDARGAIGGPVQISLPEFALETGKSLELRIDVPGAEGSTITLAATLTGGIEAQLPASMYKVLARVPDPENAISKALKESGAKLRVREGPNMRAVEGLAVSLASRLPRSTSKAWSDLYAHDPALRSLSLVPGMRLRLEAILPVTADIRRELGKQSKGSITAPSYLYLSPADSDESGPVTLSPALRGLDMDGSGKCDAETCPNWNDRWTDAEGLSSLVEQRWRYWIAVYPKRLGRVEPSLSQQLAFVHENLEPTEGAPAVLLVAASKVEDLAAFIMAAKKIQEATKSGTVAIDCKLINTPAVNCFVLRYRVLPIPEILVTVQGAQRWVEVGTTVGMVLSPHEPLRAPRELAGAYDRAIEEWRNAGTRVNPGRLDVHRLYRGGRHRIEVLPDTPADAIRSIVLQPGDEIKWSN